jgi:6-pyruvoyltetrahydropterin/6-carboxytetrahydropterin synthase
MPRTSLLRVLRFRATHRYGHPEWSGADNERAFGSLARSHPHDFRVEVEVAGEADPETGFIVDLSALDRVLHAEVVRPLEGQELNEVIDGVRDGTLQPSTEVLARWIGERILPLIPPPARLVRVRAWESDTLGSEVSWP